MKVALCFSGLPRGNYNDNIQKFKNIFSNSDAFFSTWRGNHIEGQDYTTYQEPEQNFYSEADLSFSNKKEVYLRGHKQIIAHALQLLFDVPKEYDMIARCRYDCQLNEEIDWQKMLATCYENNYVYGFSPGDWNRVRLKDERLERARISDQMIFHKRKEFDIPHTFALFERGCLQPCEIGWYQAFSNVTDGGLGMGSKHYNYTGGINIIRDPETKILIERTSV